MSGSSINRSSWPPEVQLWVQTGSNEVYAHNIHCFGYRVLYHCLEPDPATLLILWNELIDGVCMNQPIPTRCRETRREWYIIRFSDDRAVRAATNEISAVHLNLCSIIKLRPEPGTRRTQSRPQR